MESQKALAKAGSFQPVNIMTSITTEEIFRGVMRESRWERRSPFFPSRRLKDWRTMRCV